MKMIEQNKKQEKKKQNKTAWSCFAFLFFSFRQQVIYTLWSKHTRSTHGQIYVLIYVFLDVWLSLYFCAQAPHTRVTYLLGLYDNTEHVIPGG